MKKNIKYFLIIIMFIIFTGCENSNNNLVCSKVFKNDNYSKTKELNYMFDKTNTKVINLEETDTYKFNDYSFYKGMILNVDLFKSSCNELESSEFDCNIETDDKKLEIIVSAKYNIENENVRKSFKLDLNKKELKKYLEIKENGICK